MEHRKTDNTLLSSFGYGFDNVNNKDARQVVMRQARGADNVLSGVQTVGFGYDTVDQLQEEATSGAAPTSALPQVTQSHRFDAMGNRTLWSDAQNKRRSDSIYNEVNQLTQSKSYDTNTAPATLQSTTNFGYDAKGNLTATASTDGSGAPSGSATYTYDDADRLTGITSPGSSKREFLYDGMSRMRVSRNWTWSNGAWVPQSETRRVYDGMDVVQERDGSNAVTANYTRLGNIGGILSRSTSSGNVYFGYDGTGNVTELTDNTGAVVGTYAYDAFGNTIATSGAAASNPYRFSTKEDVGGLYYYGSRFYAPGMGRWLNRDPLRESGGLNVYGFNRNSPTNFVDPDGACPWAVTGAIGAAGGALIGAGVAWWQGKSTHDILVAAGRGAIIGGIAGLTGGLAGGYVAGALGGGFWAGAAAGVTAGVVGDVAGQSAEKLFGWRDCYDWNQTLMSGGIGGLMGGASAAKWLCFAAGTRVLMADGTSKPIEEVKAGDQVLSRDESSGKTETKRVKQTFERQVDATLVLHFSNGEQIETTKEHPFYVEHKGFTPAGELGIGTSIVTRAGPSVTLVKVDVKNAATTVYNFEVEDAHSYFVGQGALWVHNVCWGTARKNFWIAEADSAVNSGSNKYSANNLLRMADGKAPRMKVEVMKNGQLQTRDVSMELHHQSLPQRSGAGQRNQAWNLTPVAPWSHAAMDPFRHTGYALQRIINGVGSW